MHATLITIWTHRHLTPLLLLLLPPQEVFAAPQHSAMRRNLRYVWVAAALHQPAAIAAVGPEAYDLLLALAREGGADMMDCEALLGAAR